MSTFDCPVSTQSYPADRYFSDRDLLLPVCDAVTMVMVRDGTSDPEVFLLKRHSMSDFLGGVYVFPGGKVDTHDVDAAEVRQRRFDTRFFLARVPQGQQARTDDSETPHSAWLTPCEALRYKPANQAPVTEVLPGHG
ncbi:NUDIX hydrolase [Bradyrhizobium pachyrhizi]|uniref:NUDIX hydrolase n=1 Tax=Bradyrhizobium pachyrhizi TaxID=280333 RepID=UPI00128FC381|nr:NUDIX hydrolase [Bradyrhizobium pachyrhizi]